MISGKPMIQWVYERARKAQSIDRCWSPPMMNGSLRLCADSQARW
jgi:hypothetical protein